MLERVIVIDCEGMIYSIKNGKAQEVLKNCVYELIWRLKRFLSNPLLYNYTIIFNCIKETPDTEKELDEFMRLIQCCVDEKLCMKKVFNDIDYDGSYKRITKDILRDLGFNNEISLLITSNYDYAVSNGLTENYCLFLDDYTSEQLDLKCRIVIDKLLHKNKFEVFMKFDGVIVDFSKLDFIQNVNRLNKNVSKLSAPTIENLEDCSNVYRTEINDYAVIKQLVSYFKMLNGNKFIRVRNMENPLYPERNILLTERNTISYKEVDVLRIDCSKYENEYDLLQLLKDNYRVILDYLYPQYRKCIVPEYTDLSYVNSILDLKFLMKHDKIIRGCDSRKVDMVINEIVYSFYDALQFNSCYCGLVSDDSDSAINEIMKELLELDETYPENANPRRNTIMAGIV